MTVYLIERYIHQEITVSLAFSMCAGGVGGGGGGVGRGWGWGWGRGGWGWGRGGVTELYSIVTIAFYE